MGYAVVAWRSVGAGEQIRLSNDNNFPKSMRPRPASAAVRRDTPHGAANGARHVDCRRAPPGLGVQVWHPVDGHPRVPTAAAASATPVARQCWRADVVKVSSGSRRSSSPDRTDRASTTKRCIRWNTYIATRSPITLDPRWTSRRLSRSHLRRDDAPSGRCGWRYGTMVDGLLARARIAYQERIQTRKTRSSVFERRAHGLATTGEKRDRSPVVMVERRALE